MILVLLLGERCPKDCPQEKQWWLLLVVGTMSQESKLEWSGFGQAALQHCLWCALLGVVYSLSLCFALWQPYLVGIREQPAVTYLLLQPVLLLHRATFILQKQRWATAHFPSDAVGFACLPSLGFTQAMQQFWGPRKRCGGKVQP